MTIHVQSSGGTPLPTQIAIADFKNGAYSIGSVPKTLTDLYVVGFENPGDSGTVGIVTDVGFEAEWIGGGTGTSDSALLVATSGLEAVLDPVVGYSGVFDVSAATVNHPPTNYYAQVDWDGGVDDCYLSIGISSAAPDYDEQYVYIRTGKVPPTYQEISEVESGTTYRIAFSLSAAGVSVSVNGGDVVSVAFPADYTIGFKPDIEVAIFPGSDATIGGKATFAGVKYYPLAASTDELKLLSA